MCSTDTRKIPSSIACDGSPAISMREKSLVTPGTNPSTPTTRNTTPTRRATVRTGAGSRSVGVCTGSTTAVLLRGGDGETPAPTRCGRAHTLRPCSRSRTPGTMVA
ncbi:hypothetical protein GCM10025868_31450 [Angustibacter aerolatus]|uniref:Uncharacterized protein n=1 Tax=Angustibacter aerolatus TaxID=1162965 RepID=A0ABQ6JMA5_9ACTN|nr:hypothetical protein GCM10025868_31450 [Angustibacter aerolatus]